MAVKITIQNGNELGRVIQYHRKEAGLSRNELAMIAGVGRTAIYDVEHGKISVQLKTILKLMAILNISILLESPLMKIYESEQHHAQS